jgi:hypothetical protein
MELEIELSVSVYTDANSSARKASS